MTFSTLLATATLHSFVISPGVPCFVQKLTPSGPPSTYGFSVGADGEHVVLGGPAGEGAAAFFRRVGGDWIELNTVLDPAAGLEQAFGWAAAIDGDRAVIGGPKMDPTGSGPGHAYVFTFNGSSWGGQTALVSSDSADNDRFGIAVGIHGDRIIVGREGAAYVFRWDGGGWSQEAKLVRPDAGGEGRFGWAVDITPDLAVVGDDSDDENGTRSGAIYVFIASSGSWVFDTKIIPADAVPSDRFGQALSLDGVRVLAGSPGDDDGGAGSGSAYIFERLAGLWVERDKLTASDGDGSDGFGGAVSLKGTTAIIGAANDEYQGGAGSVYFFVGTGTAWSQNAKFSPTLGGNLGLSVALDGGTAVSGGGLGDAYIFAAPCIPATGRAGLALLGIGLGAIAILVMRKKSILPACAAGSCLLLLSEGVVAAAPPRVSGAEHPNHLLVRFKADVSAQRRQAAHLAADGKVLKHFTIVSDLVLVSVPDGKLGERLVEYLDNPDVLDAEPDYFIYPAAVPNDSGWSHMRGMQSIRAPAGWDIWTGDQDFRVAVLDWGLKLDHLDFFATQQDQQAQNWANSNIWANQAELNGQPETDDDDNGCVDDFHGCNFVDPTEEPIDTFGHGTHVSGTIGAFGNNSEGIVGVNWRCKIIPLKIIPDSFDGQVSNAIAALEYIVANNIKVSNNSWGCKASQCDPVGLDMLHDAIEATQAIGHIFVAAAGNDAQSNDGADPFYPASFDLANIISVAAADPNEKLATFYSGGLCQTPNGGSNYGRISVDLAAPGTGDYNCPSVAGCAGGLYSTHVLPTYRCLQGTSMAAPHVTGVVALVWSRSPTMTWQEVRDRVLHTVRQAPYWGSRVATGGILDVAGAVGDCNLNGVDDYIDIHVNQTSDDCNGNDFPDECEDCNGNGFADSCDIQSQTSEDCNNNTFPDECDIASGASMDCDENQVPDECEPQGTCCDGPSGVTCSVRTEACCEEFLDGVWLGDTTADKCRSDPRGACCLSTGGCVNSTISACCLAGGGQYGGNGSTCAGGACAIFGPQP